MSQKILVIQVRHIGEILFTTPLFRVLRAVYPDAQIDALIDGRFAELLQHNPAVSNVIPIDSLHMTPGMGYFRQVVKELRRTRYTLAINFHRSERISLLAVLSGAQRRVGTVHPLLRPFFHDAIVGRTDIHQAEANLELAYAAGVPRGTHQGLELYTDQATEATVDEKWAMAGLAGVPRVVGVNPGASIPIKRWPAAHFAQLITHLRAQGFTPVLFGGQADLAASAEITELLDASPVIFTGQLKLLELAAMIRRCTLFVSSDSGPMHVAASQGVPTVALFGPTNETRYHPYQVPHRLLRLSTDCPHYPCKFKVCPLDWCLGRITPEMALDAASALLAETAGGRS